MLMDINELAALLQRSPETIRKDLTRNPAAVPPRVVLPRTRLLRWRTADVDTWLRAHVQGAAE
jgi:predicted DNA-binding transcriptional regulator AlpA